MNPTYVLRANPAKKQWCWLLSSPQRRIMAKLRHKGWPFANGGLYSPRLYSSNSRRNTLHDRCRTRRYFCSCTCHHCSCAGHDAHNIRQRACSHGPRLSEMYRLDLPGSHVVQHGRRLTRLLLLWQQFAVSVPRFSFPARLEELAELEAREGMRFRVEDHIR